MSLINPLHDYISYNYHHVILCYKNGSLRSLDTSTDFNEVFGRNSGEKYALREYNGIPYTILLNTMCDATYGIDHLEFDTAPLNHSPQNSAGIKLQSLFNEMHMTIIEPHTADFLTALDTCAKSLGTTVPQLNFALKIVFVGHSSNTTTQIPTQIPLLEFKPSLVKLKLSERGMIYTFEKIMLAISGIGERVLHKDSGGYSYELPMKLSDALDTLAQKMTDDYNYAANNTNTKKIKYYVGYDDKYKDSKYKIDTVHPNNTNIVTQ
jgi:hypothetical protein